MVDLSEAVWRKSSLSSGNGACVEITHVAGYAAARDSKHPAGRALVVEADAFRTFVRQVGERNPD